MTAISRVESLENNSGDVSFVHRIALLSAGVSPVLPIEAKNIKNMFLNKMHRISCLHHEDNLSCAFCSQNLQDGLLLLSTG